MHECRVGLDNENEAFKIYIYIINIHICSYLRVFLYTLFKDQQHCNCQDGHILPEVCPNIDHVSGCGVFILHPVVIWTECLSHIDPYTLCTLCTAPADGFLSLQWTLDITTCPLVLAWGGGWGGCLPVYAVCSSGKRQRARYVSVVHIYLSTQL